MPKLGFHYFPDELHYRRADRNAWLPELQALDAKSVTLIGSMTRAVPEDFIGGLLDAGIEPIIHLPAVPTRPDPQHIAEATLSRWLTETQIQSRALDNLLRVYFAFPDVRSALLGQKQDPRLGTNVGLEAAGFAGQ